MTAVMTAPGNMNQGVRSMQGIAVPAAAVDPASFFAATRRLTVLQNTRQWAGFGSTDIIQVLQTGILYGLVVRFTGTLTVTLAAGTCATTARWPYDLIRAARLSANGQSNLINASGWNLKFRDMVMRGDLNDRGVTRGYTGASPGTQINQGTLSLASESWGVNEAVTAIPGAPTNYPVDLVFYVPVAMDDVNLVGAIFAQTTATDINLAIDWAPITDLFALTGAASVSMTGTLITEARLCSIPQGPNGIVIPDLSTFHSLIQTRNFNVGNGDNEYRLPGQGIGRQLMRVWHRTWNGAGQASAPLAVNDTNYGQTGWRYGGNDTPELWSTAGMEREFYERIVSSDLGVQGFVIHDFCNENAFRDSIDEGAATELRVLFNHPTALSLSSPVVELTQETLFSGAAGA